MKRANKTKTNNKKRKKCTVDEEKQHNHDTVVAQLKETANDLDIGQLLEMLQGYGGESDDLVCMIRDEFATLVETLSEEDATDMLKSLEY